jgi:hypothetical protein
MAVELGLNRYVSCPSSNETEYHMRERRNRERTYFVLFVHDRSLSMQTGRPEDVISTAFFHSRRIVVRHNMRPLFLTDQMSRPRRPICSTPRELQAPITTT